MSELEYPQDLRYTAEHEWVRVGDDGTVRIGITSFAQDALGDVVYVSLPAVGDTVAAGDACGEVESTKSVSDLYAPARRRGHGGQRARSTPRPSWSTPTPTARAGCTSCARPTTAAVERPARRGGIPGPARLTRASPVRTIRCGRRPASPRVCALLEGADRTTTRECGPMNGSENDDADVPARTSRRRCGCPGINDLEQVDTSAETEVALSKADQATVDALRPGTALLVVLRGPNTGARFLLDDDEVNSGRHPDSDIFLDDVTVSRKHAIFRREDDTFVVRDVGLAQRHLRQPRADRRGHPADRRRGPDRQVPARLLRRQGLTQAPRRRQHGPLVSARTDATVHDDRRGPRCPAARTSRTSRSPRSASSRPRAWSRRHRTGSGYRTYSDGGPRPAALRPHRAARPLLAAQGDRATASTRWTAG